MKNGGLGADTHKIPDSKMPQTPSLSPPASMSSKPPPKLVKGTISVASQNTVRNAYAISPMKSVLKKDVRMEFGAWMVVNLT